MARGVLECLCLLMDRLATVCVPAHDLPVLSPQLLLLYHRWVRQWWEVEGEGRKDLQHSQPVPSPLHKSTTFPSKEDSVSCKERIGKQEA
jgi:hypothetical protein